LRGAVRLLCAQGIEVRGRWWRQGWRELNADPGPRLDEGAIELGARSLSAEEEQGELRRRIEALARRCGPREWGAYSTAVLEYEMKGWQRFSQSRAGEQLYGLIPGITRAMAAQGGFDQSLWHRVRALNLWKCSGG